VLEEPKIMNMPTNSISTIILFDKAFKTAAARNFEVYNAVSL
jgi:hypothetical protein